MTTSAARQCPQHRAGRQFRRRPEHREGPVRAKRNSRARSALPPSTPSTLSASPRRASITSPPRRRWASPPTFVVPTGNFGDIFAGEAAMRMGLAVERLVIATNANDIMARALNDGVYAVGRRASHPQPLDGYSGGVEFRARPVRSLGPRRRLDRAPRWRLRARPAAWCCRQPVLAALRARYSAFASDDADTLATIKARARRNRPHHRSRTPPSPSARCANSGIRDAPMVILSTAHPAKFPDAVTRATGTPPPMPDAPAAAAGSAGKAGNSAQ